MFIIVILIIVFVYYQNENVRQKLDKDNFHKLTFNVSNNYPLIITRIPLVDTPYTFCYSNDLLVPIRDQNNCNSCWAFIIAYVMGDRISIMTKGKHKPIFSVQQLLECTENGNCDTGGIPEKVFFYLIDVGLTEEINYPYNYQKIEKCSEKVFHTWKIIPGSQRSICEPGNIRENILQMKTEIFQNGPIIGTIDIYDDLYNHNPKDVYKRAADSKLIGGHCVEIIGWGTNYWICRNSWGYDMPETKYHNYGILKINMGSNEVGIEDRASSFIPLIVSHASHL